MSKVFPYTGPGVTNEALIRHMVSLGQSLWSACLNGSGNGIKQHAWMSSPEPGDLVVALYVPNNVNAIGRLIRVGYEYCFTDDYWEEVKEDWNNDRPSEKIWRISLLTDGSECRWENVQFVRLPEDYQAFCAITN